MKRIEDIEKMEWDELEAAAQEVEVPVPPGLEARIRASLAAKALVSPRPKPAVAGWVPYAALAAAAALAAVAVIPRSREDRLPDTFDDPYLAYAQVEATFRTISDKMTGSIDLAAAKAGETAGKTKEIIQKITEP